MTRFVVTLFDDIQRERARKAVDRAPLGYVVEFKPATRTSEQNARMWAMLTDVAEQLEYYGRKLSPDQWKDLFTASLHAAEVVPNLDGTGVVQFGRRTSTMTKEELSDLMEVIAEYGARKGVQFQEKAA